MSRLISSCAFLFQVVIQSFVSGCSACAEREAEVERAEVVAHLDPEGRVVHAGLQVVARVLVELRERVADGLACWTTARSASDASSGHAASSSVSTLWLSVVVWASGREPRVRVDSWRSRSPASTPRSTRPCASPGAPCARLRPAASAAVAKRSWRLQRAVGGRAA
jgi:hypothetical protein